MVEGIPLTTLKYCPVNLKEAEPPFCEAPTVQTERVESRTDSEASSLVTYIVLGIVVVIMMVVIAVLTCL